MQENVRLERETKSLASDTLSLFNDLQAQIARASKAKAQKDAVLKQIYDINYGIDPLHMDALSREIDSLKAVQGQLTKVKASKEQQLSQLNKSLTQLKVQAGGMSGYVQQSLDANIAVLGKKLSTITGEQLDEMAGKLDYYAGSPGFDEYKSRLADARGKLRLYERAVSALNFPYDPARVERLCDELDPVLSLIEDLPDEGKFVLTDEQYDELNTLYIALSRYRGGVVALHELIAKVNNDDEVLRCRADRDKAGCIEVIGALVNARDEATTYVRERYFEMIPYLGKLLQDYWDAVQEDPLTTSRAEELINQLEAE